MTAGAGKKPTGQEADWAGTRSKELFQNVRNAWGVGVNMHVCFMGGASCWVRPVRGSDDTSN